MMKIGYVVLLIVVGAIVLFINDAKAGWYHDGYGYVSNVCRNGYYWQYVPYNYTGTKCYMSMHGMYGYRVAE